MGIDSGYGVGSLKTGVCTSTTRPAVPFEGQTIYETDTDLTKVYNGTAFVNVSALVRVGGGALSGTSTAFTNVFSATYNAYKLDFTDCTTSGNADIFMILGATTTGYYGAAPAALYSTNAYATNIGAQNNAAAWAVSFANATNLSFTTELWNPNLARKTFYRSGPIQLGSLAGTGQGILDNTTQYTGFTISASTGNLTGTCNIYGYSLS